MRGRGQERAAGNLFLPRRVYSLGCGTKKRPAKEILK